MPGARLDEDTRSTRSDVGRWRDAVVPGIERVATLTFEELTALSDREAPRRAGGVPAHGRNVMVPMFAAQATTASSVGATSSAVRPLGNAMVDVST